MLDNKEIETVLKDLLDLHDYDFTYYSRDSLKRRINRIYKLERYQSFSEFRNKLLTKGPYIDHLIDRLTVNVTDMFRDSNFFRQLKQQILPQLSEKRLIRIWHAGCSTGEEVYSLAILLHEADILKKAIIKATDINQNVLAKARNGVFTTNQVRRYSKNYLNAGGENDFASYFSPTAEGEKFSSTLRSGITFSNHNLASGHSIGKFDLIVCRNVLIYFEREFQKKAFKLFDLSSSPGSFLALGEKETIHFSGITSEFRQVGNGRIWKKV